jgi:hypothetical protein
LLAAVRRPEEGTCEPEEEVLRPAEGVAPAPPGPAGVPAGEGGTRIGEDGSGAGGGTCESALEGPRRGSGMIIMHLASDSGTIACP